jgi:molybdenum cofactor cytidylyltransferase
VAAQEVIGVVLAAGDGARMGRSKALLLVGDEPLAVGHARRAIEGGCARVVLVVRPEVAPKLPAMDRVEVVTSMAEDQAGSLAVAVRAIAPPEDAVLLVTPVDCAPVRAPTIEQLLGALKAGVDAVTPRIGDKSGHPIVCRASVLAPYAGASPPPLRDVLRALGDRRARLDVADPLVAVDLDTPEDVAALTGAPPRFVG